AEQAAATRHSRGTGRTTVLPVFHGASRRPLLVVTAGFTAGRVRCRRGSRGLTRRCRRRRLRLRRRRGLTGSLGLRGFRTRSGIRTRRGTVLAGCLRRRAGRGAGIVRSTVAVPVVQLAHQLVVLV